MADQIYVTPKTNWVAIDVAKEWNAVLIETNEGHRHRFKMLNNAADHDRLVAFLRGLSGDCRIALEPTGVYHRPLAYRLKTEGFEVLGISSVAQARYREAQFGTWDKNDPKDAQVILSMLKQGLVQVYHDPLIAGNHDLQELSGLYFQVTLARTRVQHSLLTHYLPLYFPEMHKYWNTTRADWFIRLLWRFPTPAHVRALPREAFVVEAGSLIGRRVRKRAKLDDIYDMAHASVGLPVATDSIAVETFRLQLQRYQDLNAQRTTLDQRAQQLLAGHPQYARLISLPGIGAILALTILAEAGDLRRFKHYRQFLKYCGLDLAKSQSGATRGKERLSKRGNARLRMAFWLAGLRAVHMTENAFRDKYERYLRGHPNDADTKRKALTAVAAKMARVAYAVIKKDQPYRRFFEQSLPSGSIPLTRAVEAMSTS